MGSGSWDASTWNTYRAHNVAGRTRQQLFANKALLDPFNPAKITLRESRDSADNPLSTPIIIGADVTGSMGMVAHALMQTGINTLCTEIYDRKSVTNPHIMTAAIGDVFCDAAPLQVSQFEADIRIADQTKSFWMEGGGGGNQGESYSGLHLFAALKTSHDSFEKRRKKGYLFTIGDEPNLGIIPGDRIKPVFGIDVQTDLTALDCVRMASRTYELFHILLVNEGYARSAHGLEAVRRSWNPILPERVVELDDYTKLAEVVVSVIQVHEGMPKAAVRDSWSGSTAMVVANAIKGLGARAAGGIVRL